MVILFVKFTEVKGIIKGLGRIIRSERFRLDMKPNETGICAKSTACVFEITVESLKFVK